VYRSSYEHITRTFYILTPLDQSKSQDGNSKFNIITFYQSYPFLSLFINHIPENISADAFSRLVKPHVCKSHQLNTIIITEEEVFPAQTGSIDEHDAAGIALHSVREEGPESEHHDVPAQTSYSETRGAAIALHHGPMGHFGIYKTFESAKTSELDQINKRENIKEYIKFCPTCQKMSYIRPTIHSIPYVSSGTKPMYEVCIDSVGPFPADKDDCKHIIVIIGSFTRYLTLYRSVNTSDKVAGKALFNHCCTYGVPKMIHTDNGAQYVNGLISTFTKLFKIIDY
jgi:hypothetical protein